MNYVFDMKRRDFMKSSILGTSATRIYQLPENDVFSAISESSYGLEFTPILTGIGQPTSVDSWVQNEQRGGGDNEESKIRNGEFIWTDKIGIVSHADIDGRTRIISDYSNKVIIESWEQGLLSAVRVPEKNDLIVYYTAPANRANLASVAILEYIRMDKTLNPRESFELLRIPQKNPIHNGGSLSFVGQDNLVLAVGDDNGNGHNRRYQGADHYLWSWRSSQHDDLPYGKLLIIDISDISTNPDRSYLVESNQFSGTSEYNSVDVPVVRSENISIQILAKGLRNPWSFDVQHSSIVIGDVGSSVPGELNYLPDVATKQNFGWDVEENSALNCSADDIYLRKSITSNPLLFLNPFFYYDAIQNEFFSCTRTNKLTKPTGEIMTPVASYPRSHEGRMIGQSIVVGSMLNEKMISGKYLFGDLRGEDGPTFFTTSMQFDYQQNRPQPIEIHGSNLGRNQHLLNIFDMQNGETWVATTDFSDSGGSIHRLTSLTDA